MSNKLEILDAIIDLEDKLEEEAVKNVTRQVMAQIKEKYGANGIEVANIYYKNEQGHQNIDECPECAEKAKKLIEHMKTAQMINDSISSDEVNKIYSILVKEYPWFEERLKNDLKSWVKALKIDETAITTESVMAMCMIKWLVTHTGK